MIRVTVLTFLTLIICKFSFAHKLETEYLDTKDSTTNRCIAVIPEGKSIKSFMFLLDGFGASPEGVLLQTDLPKYAAQQGILTIIPVLKTGSLYFGVDDASQKSLKDQIEIVKAKYKLEGKDFYIGGFSIGGSCAVKYAELALQHDYATKPKAIFAIDSPLDWEGFYKGAKRVVRLSDPANVNQEVTYMIDRIEKEMNGTPETALSNFHRISPYSFSDTTQKAIKNLVNMPVMFISEPDIQWWLKERGYDLSYMNIGDQAAMINELQKLGNNKAILVTTTNKGYRKPNNQRHPHSWSIAEPSDVVGWLLKQ